MDIFDRAQEADAKFRNQAIAHHRRQCDSSSSGRTHCLDCGCEIPAARLAAVPSCERCVDCEEANEALRRR